MRSSIKTRLLALTGFMLVAIVIATATGVRGLYKDHESLETITTQKLPAINSVTGFRIVMSNIHRFTIQAWQFQNESGAQRRFQEALRNKSLWIEKLENYYKSYDLLPKSKDEEKLWKEIQEPYKKWRELNDRIDREILIELSKEDFQANRQTELFAAFKLYNK